MPPLKQNKTKKTKTKTKKRNEMHAPRMFITNNMMDKTTDATFLVSAHGLACQREIPLVLVKAWLINYRTIDG